MGENPTMRLSIPLRFFIFNIHSSDWQVSGTSFYHLEARGLRVVGKEWGCVFFWQLFF